MVYICKLYIKHLLGKLILMFIQIGHPCKWADDSQHFLLENFDIICKSPLQIYHFALPFSPSSSWIRKCYSRDLLQKVRVVKGLQTDWGTCSRTVPFNHCPQTLACWKDLVAVGLWSGNVIILDAVTGVHKSVLSRHTDWVRSLIFSSDGAFLVSGSDDKTINLWDIQTGVVIKTFYGHTGPVLSISISLDCTRIASGSRDKTVCVWNTQTGECCCTIEQQGGVSYVGFSPTNSQRLISTSSNKVQQWDVNGHKIGAAYSGSYTAFSLDGTQFIICEGKDVVVRKSDSGTVVAEFHIVNNDINHWCSSPDGKLVAGATGNTVYIWDITGSDPHPIKTLIGHTNTTTSLAFSSSLISASEDQSVKFWQISASLTDPVIDDIVSTPFASASIESVSLQAKDNIVISSDSAGVVKTWNITTGLCEASFQTLAFDKTWRDVQLIEGRLILVWHEDYKIYIWDTVKSDLLQTVDVPGPEVSGLRISGDGSKVFCLTGRFIQAWSMQTGEAVGRVELKSNPSLDPLCVDGSRIWVCFADSSIQGWDFGVVGLPPILVPSTPLERPRLDFINSIRWQNPGLAKVEDTVTRKEVFQLSGRDVKLPGVRWDGQYLVASNRSGEVLILDFNPVLSQ